MESKETKKFLDKTFSINPKMKKIFNIKPGNILHRIGLSLPQLLMLKIIYHCDRPPSLSYLSQRMQFSNSMITHFIDFLVENSFITRKRDPEDRRVVRVSLTGVGKKVIDQFKKHQREEFKKILRNFNPRDREQFIKSIENIYRIVTKYE